MAAKLAVVSGGNQGIGLEICRLLGKSMHVIMGCRDLEKGEAAARALVTEGSNVTAHALDITSDASVAALAHTIADKHGAKLDVLINNAGFAYKGDAFGAEEARTTIGVNVYGTMRLTDALLPFIKLSTHGGRVVNVCSQAGHLSQVSPALQARFQDPEATPESVTKLMEEFIAAVADGSYEAKGWPRSMYGVSKLGEIAYTYSMVRQLQPFGVSINACCPGYCSTSMSSYRGGRTAAQGAETPVWLATREGSVADITGGFYYDMALIAW